MEFTITLQGAQEAQTKLKKLTTSLDRVPKDLYTELEVLANWLTGEVQKRTPSSGASILRDSIKPIMTEGVSLEALISTPLNYGPPVEFGSKPHFPWPLDSLRSWVHRKLGKSGKEAEQVTRAIAFAMKAGETKIQQEGGAKMFQEAWDENLPEIQRRLEAIGVHVSKKLLKQL